MRASTAVCLLLLGSTACVGGAASEPDEPAAAAAADPAAAPTAPVRTDRAREQGLPSVVLVTMDTTRADYLGAYGRADAHTENFDALAASGRRFARAYSPVPLTIPSHSTLFTGLNPYHHGVRNNGDSVLEGELTTLAEYLWASGYDTAASVAAFVTQRQWGLNQGFEVYMDQLPEPEGGQARNEWHLSRPGDQVVDDALSWLEGRQSDRPYFLWVHLYDAHSPYKPPGDYAEIKDLYAAELAYQDDVLGRLIEGIGDDDTLWVVAGDHGEARGRHFELTHGLFVYNATQHVPLVIAGPGIAPEVIEQPVGLVDVTPTVLSLLGLEIPEGLDGRPQPGSPHPIYMETHQLTDQYGYAHHSGIVDGDYKLVATPRPELYSMLSDEDEQVDLAGDKPEELARLQAALAGLEVIPRERAGDSEIDPETLAQLAAMGYIGATDAPEGPLDDPKDHRDVIELLQRASLEQMLGARDKEAPLLERALELEPRLLQPRVRLSRIYMQESRPDEAAAQVEELLEYNGESSVALENAVLIYLQQGEAGRAHELAEAGVILDPESTRFREFYVITLLQQGERDEALRYGLDFLRGHPEAYAVAAVLGISLAHDGDWKQAEPLLRLAARAEEPRRDVHRYLGAMAAATHHEQEALAHFEAELENHTQNLQARALYAKLLGQLERYGGQLQQIDALIRLSPKNPDNYQARAMTLLSLGRAQDALDAAQAGLEKFEGHPGLQLMVANALKKLGRDDEALAAFELAKQYKAAWPSRPQ